MSWFEYIAYAFIAYYFFANSIYFILLLAAYFSVRHSFRERSLFESLSRRTHLIDPPLSLVVPAYNEEKNIIASVKNFLSLEYPKFEVIVVNDGSTDGTLELLKAKYLFEPKTLSRVPGLTQSSVRGSFVSRMHPNLILIDKENGGKADAQNCGIEFASTELICIVDADSLLEADSLHRVVLPFLKRDSLVAVGGVVRPVNSSEIKLGRVTRPGISKNYLALIQIVEYFRAFLFGRIGWNVLDATLIVSGAFGIFKKEALREVNGFRSGALAEDMDMIIRLKRHFRGKRRVDFVPDPICWTEVPSDWGSFRKQRDRWHRGLADVMFRNISMFGNPKYSWTGVLAFPYFFIVEFLGPVIELLAYIYIGVCYGMGLIQLDMLILFILVDLGFGVIMSIAAVVIEENSYSQYPRSADFFRLVLAAIMEHFGFRQFNSFARLMGMVQYLRGERSWGKMNRQGFGAG